MRITPDGGFPRVRRSKEALPALQEAVPERRNSYGEPTSGVEPAGSDMRSGGRPIVSFIAWAEDSGRANEIAESLGGEAKTFFDLQIVWKPLVPLRYVLSAIRTWAYLLLRRPRAIIVTNPPIFPGLIAFAYCKIARAPFLLDSHPSAFGSAPMFKRLRPIHVWLVRHAATTLVTVGELTDIVTAWGGRAEIVHEAPPQHLAAPASPLTGRPRVLYIGRFAGDEPTGEVLEAARLVPEVDVLVTGDERKCSTALRASAPPNVTFTGYLHGGDYDRALEQADVIIVLTGHPQAVNRGAYEAVYAGRPVIISDLPAMTPLFPYAIYVSNDGASIADGIRSAIDRHSELLAMAPLASSLQEQRWQQQLEDLRQLMPC